MARVPSIHPPHRLPPLSHVKQSPAYTRIDVPTSPTSGIGSGSYLRLGAYVQTPDKDLIDDFKVNSDGGIYVEQSSVSTTMLSDDQVKENGKAKQTDKKELFDLTSTEHTPLTSGLLLKTDKAMYLDVPDALVRKVGYESTQVTTGDHRIAITNGIHYVDAANGVKIISENGNIDLVAKGYINQKAEGPTTDWTYGDKTSKTDGTSKAYYKGTKWQEVRGTNESWTYGEKYDYVLGFEWSFKYSGKIGISLSIETGLFLGLSLKIYMAAKVDIVFPMDMKIGIDIYKICILDYKICVTDAKMIANEAKLKLTKSDINTLKTESEVLKSVGGGIALGALASKINSFGAWLKAGAADVTT